MYGFINTSDLEKVDFACLTSDEPKKSLDGNEILLEWSGDLPDCLKGSPGADLIVKYGATHFTSSEVKNIINNIEASNWVDYTI